MGKKAKRGKGRKTGQPRAAPAREDRGEAKAQERVADEAQAEVDQIDEASVPGRTGAMPGRAATPREPTNGPSGGTAETLTEASRGALHATAGNDRPDALTPAGSAGAARRGTLNGLGGFYLHLHPRQIRRRSVAPGVTLGLGVATITALALVTFSGLLLLLYYVPSVERAHQSVQDIVAIVPFGAFFRNLHRWSGHACVALCILHLLRTFLWGAYRGPHRRVWLVGVGLLLLILATSFSGYLLPWDQDAYWTVTVGTSLASYVPVVGEHLRQALIGSAEVGQVALTRFFSLHVLILPAAGLLLLVVHLFRLRRAGGLAHPSGQSSARLVPAAPLAIRAELAVALALTIAMVLLSTLIDARLGPAPDVLRPDDPPKAPWFLVGFQEMVSYSAVMGGFVFPALLFVLLAAAPWLDGGTESAGRFLPSRAERLAVSAAILTCASAAAASVIWWGDPQHGRLSWLNPASIALSAAVLVTAAAWLSSRDRGLAVRVLLSGLITALVLFTVIGWYFRGPNWRLIYHPGPGHGAPPAVEARP
jgi:quinol-cytochrome oxidoreductase complex cytochrome b subunit